MAGMSALDNHPTVKRVRERDGCAVTPMRILAAADVRRRCLEAGADDVGFVSIDRPEIAAERTGILRFFPPAKTLVSFVCRMNRENIRRPERSVANLEFHRSTDHVNDVARAIVASFERDGVRAANGGAAGFPMEASRWGNGRMWVLSHKPVAVAAGLGRMGIHRNVIHPKFGNFILLGTVLVEAEIDVENRPIDYNPCLECKLCVAACPTGAISADGHFDFSACYTHNYREFMGGFDDWIGTVASAGSAKAYHQKVTSAETVSMWQSLSFGANYKAAYCMAVCPAGEDVISPFLTDRKQYLEDYVKPLREKAETVYVVAGSDAEAHVSKHFSNKRTKPVANGLRTQSSVRAFLAGLPLVFQRERSTGIDAVYHFTFTGAEIVRGTVTIRDKSITVAEGHVGSPNLRVTVDATIWLRFVRKEANLLLALMRRRIRLKGSPRLLLAFSRCFP
jgi:Fe-S-cluster-containing hydrogenase component 2